MYDMRTGEFLGAGDDLPSGSESDAPRVIAYLPYRVRNLTLMVRETVVTAGNTLSFSTSVIPLEAGVRPVRHVFALRALDPDGYERSCYTSSYDAPGGKLDGTLHVAFNETPGRWKLVIRDVASGKQVERTFMVMSPGGRIHGDR